MKPSEALLNELESLFISEFRACQAIHRLTISERQTLSQGDVARLPGLTNRKADLLDKLSRLDAAKYDLLRQTGALPEEPSNTLKTLHLIDFLKAIDKASAQRLLRIQEGSQILRAQVRELARGNRALATGALQRTNSLQADLLRTYQLPERPTTANSEGFPTEPDDLTEKVSAVFASLITARDALHASDRKALSIALEDLQQALEKLSGETINTQDLAKTAARQEMAKPALYDAAEVAGGTDPSLVETIASLYHQQSAYQASLKISNRMLAIP